VTVIFVRVDMQEAHTANVAFGAADAIVLACWVYHEVTSRGWLAMVKCILALVAVVCDI
jgi:hypothetical protein